MVILVVTIGRHRFQRCCLQLLVVTFVGISRYRM